MRAAWARWKWPAAFALCLLAAGLQSVRQRLDVNWDLRNYHFYNAFAFLNDRLGWDVAPAQIQTYFSPFLDLPFYYLVRAVASPRIVAFTMGVTAGIGAFCLLRMLAVLFPRGRVEDRGLWVALAWAVGVTGSMATSTIGSTMNEWPPAMLLLVALTVLVSSVAGDRGLSRAALALAGTLVGIAVGLKLTYGVFGFALVFAAGAFGTFPERATRIVATGFFLFAGFMASYGYWGWILYREFGNPFFPFFNALFQSPWWEPVSIFDRNFGPRDAMQAVVFPFYIARGSRMVSEVSFRDWRLAVLFVLSMLCLARCLYLRRTLPAPGGRPAVEPVENAWRLLAVFTLAAYLIWLKVFGIYRYLVPLELLSGPLIVGAALYLVPGRNTRRVAIVILAILIIGSTRKGSWGRVDFRDAYFDVSVPTVPADSLVILGDFEPTAYIIPFFPPGTRFVNPVSNLLHYEQKNLLARRVADVVAAHAGPVYSLDFWNRDGVSATLEHYGLARDLTSCRGVRSNLDADAMRLCGVERLRR